MKEIAPSDNLRKWFAHRQERWEDFVQRYQEELKNKKEFLDELKEISKNKTVTLLFSAKDEERNNARALLGFIEGSMK